MGTPTNREYHGRGRVCGQVTPEYRIWCNIKQRCRNPNNPAWGRYGGSGIDICPRWAESFAAFVGDMGDRPSPAHSVDRRDTTKGYTCGRCPACQFVGNEMNCRWATDVEQARNTRKTVLLRFRDVVKPLTAWCEELGVDPRLVRRRIKEQWSPEEALTRPCQAVDAGSTEREKLYRAFRGMLSRCHNPNNSGYYKYGAIGITVCERWRSGFAAFHADMGDRPGPGYSVDRKNSILGYWCGKPECPECGPAGREPNCRWATAKEQANNRRKAIRVRYGETMREPVVSGRSVTTDQQQAESVRQRGEWMLDARLRGATQDELAAMAGITQTNAGAAIRRVKGEQKLWYTKREVAELIGVTYSLLVGWEDRGGVIPGRINGTQSILGYRCEEVDRWIAAGVPEMRERSYDHLAHTDEELLSAYRRFGSWSHVGREFGIPPTTLSRLVRKRGLTT